MQSEDALRAVTEDLFEQLVEDGVIYAEIRFAPLLHPEQGLSAERAVAVVERAAEELVHATGVECAPDLVHAASLQCGAEHADRAAGGAVSRQPRCGHRTSPGTRPAFRWMRIWQPISLRANSELHRTAHAGEARGPESVWETLRLLDPAAHWARHAQH